MISTHTDEQEAAEMEEHHPSSFGAQAFAAKIDARLRDMRDGTKYIRVWYGIIMQCLWLGVLPGTVLVHSIRLDHSLVVQGTPRPTYLLKHLMTLVVVLVVDILLVPHAGILLNTRKCR